MDAIIIICICRSPRVQEYLVRVYANLAVTTATSSLAVLLYMHDLIPEAGSLSLILTLTLMILLPLSRGILNDHLRLGILWLIGFLTGWNAGPLTQLVFNLDPDILLMSIIGTFIAFISFSGAALFSQRRSHLYLGSLLSVSGIIILISTFFPGMFNFNLYFGLFTFCFYIIYDTQILVERADSISDDRVGVNGALQLYTDLYAIFVRLMIILMRKGEKKRHKK